MIASIACQIVGGISQQISISQIDDDLVCEIPERHADCGKHAASSLFRKNLEQHAVAAVVGTRAGSECTDGIDQRVAFDHRVLYFTRSIAAVIFTSVGNDNERLP